MFKGRYIYKKLDLTMFCFIIVVVPMLAISGLFTSVFASILVLVWLFRLLPIKLNWNVLDLVQNASCTEKSLLLFILAGFISFRAQNFSISVLLWIKFLCIITATIIIYKNQHKFTKKYLDNLFISFALGLAGLIIIFFIEYCSDGFITLTTRKIFAASKKEEFFLYNLDYGCSILSIWFWSVAGWLYFKGREIIALLLYFVTIFLLSISDSSASYLAFFLSSLGVIIMLVTKFRMGHFFIFSFLALCLLMPVFAYFRPNYMLHHGYPYLPVSAKHRLHIWKTTVERFQEHPIKGWGVGTSAHVPQDREEEKFIYNDEVFPKHLHPHNNVLQLLLETGILGLTAFLLTIYYLLQGVIEINFVFNIQKNKHLWQLVALATFSSYFVIGAISYGMWQSWFLLLGSVSFLLVSMLRSRLLFSR